MKISVIIPVFNEEEHIENTLDAVTKGSNIEVIVVDGGSSDETVKRATAFPEIALFKGPRQRSEQMNLGASKSTGKILLFLHGDSLLPQDWDQEIRKAFQEPGVIAGAFKFQVDDSTLAMRILERLVEFRSKTLQLPYGDQGIFIRASSFQEIGAYKNTPIMEDYELIRKIKKKRKNKNP